MCGRFADHYEPAEIVETFAVDRFVDAPRPSWNIAPTAPIALVRDKLMDDADRTRELRTARWGLLPPWAKDPKAGPVLFNARSETVTVKPSFRAAARSRRALIPAAGYYEWQDSGGGSKTPYFLHPPGDEPIAMAGLYEWWRAESGDGADGIGPLLSATVITRAATDSTGQIHDRMPLIVPRAAWGDWLDPALTQPTAVQELIASLPDPVLTPRRVSRAVGSTRHDGPHLTQAV
jgi:putative SOS response-associated peptidase YedK